MGIFITLFFILTLALAAVWGYFRGWKRSLVRFCTVVASFILAIALTWPIGALVLEPLEPMLRSIFESDGFKALTNGSPTFFLLLENFPKAIVYPLVFWALFYVIKTLLLIAHVIICKYVDPRHGSGPDNASKWIGLGIGVGQGLICAFATIVLLGGICGIITNIDDAAASLDQEGFESVQELTNMANESFAEPLTSNFIAKVYMTCGGNALFDSFSSIEVEGENTRLDHELKHVLPFLMKFTDIVTKTDHSLKELEELRDAMKAVSSSKTSSLIVHELFVHISREWLYDSHFMGISNPGVGKYYEDDFNTVLQAVTDSKPEEVFKMIEDLLDSMNVKLPGDYNFSEGIGTGEILPPDMFD